MLFRLWEAPDLPDLTWLPDRAGVAHLVVGRHALVRGVLANQELFRPDNALEAMSQVGPGALRILARNGFTLPPTLANNSGPGHPVIRGLVADALHPARVEALRPWLIGLVRRRVARLAGRVRDGGQVDLYRELTAELPLLALARLVELPDEDVAVVTRFSRAALELFWAPVDDARQQELAGIVGPYHAVLSRFAAVAGGLVGRLREQVPTDQVVGALFFLLVAGQETTSQFLTLLLERLVAEPAVLAGLASGRVGAQDVVEEGLRLDSPIETWRRRAAADTRLGELDVPAGTPVVLWLARAGRDPDVTAHPERFEPGQGGSRRHLAFGAGPHRCAGSQLARMEAAVVVGETAPLLRRVQVRRRPWCPDNLSFRVPDTLLVGSG